MAKDSNKNNKKETKKDSSKKRSGGTDEGLFDGVKLNVDARNSILAIFSFVISLIFILAAFHAAGPAGDFLYRIFSQLFGVGYFLVPILGLLLGISLLQEERPLIAFTHTIGSVLFLSSSLALIDVASGELHKGGLIGQGVFWPFAKLFGTYAGIIFVGGLLIASILVLFNARPDWQGMGEKITQLFRKKKKDEYADEDQQQVEEHTEEIEVSVEHVEPEEVEEPSTPLENPEEEILIKKEKKESIFRPHAAYIPPPLSLLAGDRGKPQTGDIKANSNIIKRTLMNFGIEVEMDEITVGPSVTRYALKPAQGVKLSRIVSLQSDMALALAAHPIRIEAPIPGKSLVGIEIPNKAKSIVGLASLLSDDRFKNATKPLMVALGRNISGQSIVANLAKMPHALIAGATGSGKSVTIHAIITSLLYRNGPDDLRFIFVDPKRVELTLYNKIPHLLTPVITDPKKAILALKWAAKEMDRRYDILEKESVRDIESYHTNVFAKNKKKDGTDAERMPYIVIVIDELADIMQSYPRELESGIVRLAQMSRAVGIHLILSTQRPSVNVVTGLIKANVPARVALQVASQIDSRTILDAPGAEKLLGAGDMLYSSGEMASPERLQSAFISEDEVKKVVKFLADNALEEVSSEINLTGSAIGADKSIFEASLEDGGGADDDLYEEARQIVIDTQKASTSFLQRKLGIGYARAAKLIDMLEEHGIVGPSNGAKPREVMEKTVENEVKEFN